MQRGKIHACAKLILTSEEHTGSITIVRLSMQRQSTAMPGDDETVLQLDELDTLHSAAAAAMMAEKHLAVAVSKLYNPPGQLREGESGGEGELEVGAASFVVAARQILPGWPLAVQARVCPPS